MYLIRPTSGSQDHIPEPSIDALDQVIAHIEEDIRARIRHLCDLKRQRNARIAVARIPPEILADILLYVREACVERPEREASFLADQHWHSILLVSYAWHETAIATPELWTCIDLLSDKAPGYISRTGALPLKLFMRTQETSPVPTDQVLDAVCTHVGKISALTLNVRAQLLKTYVSSLALCAADTLCILEITAFRDELYTFPENLSLPGLESITLRLCQFHLGSVLLSQLDPKR